MNDDVSEIALLVGVSVAINAVYAIQHKGNTVKTVVAGGLLFVAMSLIGGITGRYDVAKALAVVFLLASGITHGIPLANGAVALATNAHSTKKTP